MREGVRGKRRENCVIEWSTYDTLPSLHDYIYMSEIG